MTSFLSLFHTLHVLAVIIWIGGMFFAHMVLRPTALELLEPPLRLQFWRRIFSRFFVWVWVAVTAIPITGGVLFAQVGFAGAPIHWHIMLTIGTLMVALFVLIAGVLYPRLVKRVEEQNWPQAGALLNRIRLIVTTNLVLGLITVIVATLGR